MTVYSSAIHPDLVVASQGWNGHRYWASFSPYPHLVSGMGNENPHVVCSDDGVNWNSHVGPGRFDNIQNPIDTRTRSRRFSYLSDPDLLLEKNQTMWLFYRGKLGTQPDTVFLLACNSHDGVNWSTPVVSLSGLKQQDMCYPLGGLSPSFVHIDSMFHLWYVNAQSTPNKIYHLQSQSAISGWHVIDSTDLGAERPSRADIWHLNVIPSPDGALLGLFTFTDSATTGKDCRLTLAASIDNGTTWIVNDTWLLDHAVDRASWDGNQIYRAGGYWDTENGEQVFRLYYSGMRQAQVPIWGTGLTTIYFSDSADPPPPSPNR